MVKLTLMMVFMIAGSAAVNADEKLVALVKKVKPSVVLIETFDKDNKPIARGSGFFIDNKGNLITNYHVVENAYAATVKTSTGEAYPVQGIVAKDTGADIAKLVVNLPDANIAFLNLSKNIPFEGEDVFVIGNPLGLESTVSNGIVSAVRDIPAFGKIFQITAPISHGSSGSPVINSKGQVIGIATLSVTQGQNLNFAIPSDKILTLKETTKVALYESYTLPTVDVNVIRSFYDKGLRELWQENYAPALSCFKKATTENSLNANAWFYAGYCYSKLSNWQRAINAFERAIAIKPNLAEVYNDCVASGIIVVVKATADYVTKSSLPDGTLIKCPKGKVLQVLGKGEAIIWIEGKDIFYHVKGYKGNLVDGQSFAEYTTERKRQTTTYREGRLDRPERSNTTQTIFLYKFNIVSAGVFQYTDLNDVKRTIQSFAVYEPPQQHVR